MSEIDLNLEGGNLYRQFLSAIAGQNCSVCTLFQGTAKDASAPCLAFGGKSVSAKGWCSAWVKKV